MSEEKHTNLMERRFRGSWKLGDVPREPSRNQRSWTKKPSVVLKRVKRVKRVKRAARACEIGSEAVVKEESWRRKRSRRRRQAA
jgi:hypothetical protein